MPLIDLKHISSFSSEDTAQPSSNLLKPETYRKWRCAEPGEKQAVVVVEMEKATKIHGIDIGNNGSALIEVLVARSSGSNDQYKVLLVTSSFMSPAESKSFTNTSRVRMFGPDKLSKPVADEKWDKVKLVCTQPFNKNERYGLSFVSLHSPPEDSHAEDMGTESVLLTPKRLGSFTLRDEEEDNIKPGSLFFRKKKSSPPPLSTAAQVRDAAVSSSSIWDKPSMGGGLFRSRQPVASKPKEERERKLEKQGMKPVKQERERKPEKQDLKPVKQDKPSVSPPSKKAKTTSQSIKDVPFNQLLKDAVFVLSGFRNPERAEIRDKALEIGAQYKPDWMTGCTHLICAFANTPKYYQVKGKGKIVTKKWIFDCYRKKRKLPTRHYHLPDDTSSSEESSDDEQTSRQWSSSSKLADTSGSPSESCTKKSSQSDKRNPVTDSPSDKTSPGKSTDKKEETDPYDEDTDDEITDQKDDIDLYDEDTDDDIIMETEKKDTHPKVIDSEQDTEDELEKVQKDKEEDDDIYDVSTEDEDNIEDQQHGEGSGKGSGPEGLPELPEFFSRKHFILYGEMDQSTRRSLIRYITAYDGVLEDYMTQSVDFVITNETWDQNFEDALSENASLAFVKPKWIFACHDKSTMVPFQPYIITPS